MAGGTWSDDDDGDILPSLPWDAARHRDEPAPPKPLNLIAAVTSTATARDEGGGNGHEGDEDDDNGGCGDDSLGDDDVVVSGLRTMMIMVKWVQDCGAVPTPH